MRNINEFNKQLDALLSSESESERFQLKVEFSKLYENEFMENDKLSKNLENTTKECETWRDTAQRYWSEAISNPSNSNVSEDKPTMDAEGDVIETGSVLEYGECADLNSLGGEF